MKQKLLLIVIAVMLSAQFVNAQKANNLFVLREVSPTEKKLSAEMNGRISSLQQKGYLKSVTLVDLGDVEDLINMDNPTFELPGKSGKINVKKTNLILNSLKDFTWSGESKNESVILTSMKGMVYGQFRKNGQA